MKRLRIRLSGVCLQPRMKLASNGCRARRNLIAGQFCYSGSDGPVLGRNRFIQTRYHCLRALLIGPITAICRLFVPNGMSIKGMRFGVIAERFNSQMPKAEMVTVRYGRPASSIEFAIGHFSGSRTRIREIKSCPIIGIRRQPMP